MSRLDRALLAEKAAAVERHLERVRQRLPEDADELRPMTDTSDIIILHLWQAVQSVIDLAGSACLHFYLGTPPSYGEAFRSLADAGILESDLAERLVRAVGFRNAVAHAYDKLDMDRVYRAAREGPDDLRGFLAALAERIQ
jgi:uncharacterized protein YutE (UPF0331/DUF86 family)